MKLTKLRIAGFKTFVDPAEFLIEPGLTGIVGPNGCGKSNLVEALRWVMGESSSKNMRASGMDDVIFSGGGDRPARNMAEVVLFLDNSDRTAPASFNDGELIEVSRRIERESGSTYRVNGREVRARDVQLLFADASTGSRSTAMVRQGQIGEIIAAKPQERRRILEEAAGIAGLHSRRHEAELRLKAAEENLTTPRRYFAADRWPGRKSQEAGAPSGPLPRARGRDPAQRGVACPHSPDGSGNGAPTRPNRSSKTACATSRKKPLLRPRPHGCKRSPRMSCRSCATPRPKAGSELQRLVLARETLDGEERRAKSRTSELERRIAQTASDIARETALIEDAASVLARLDAEAAGACEQRHGRSRRDRGRARPARAKPRRPSRSPKRRFAEAQDTSSAMEARRAALETALREETARLARLQAEIEKVTRERDTLLLRKLRWRGHWPVADGAR